MGHGYPDRSAGVAVVFQDTLWLLGGEEFYWSIYTPHYRVYHDDTWYTVDGQSWFEVPREALASVFTGLGSCAPFTCVRADISQPTRG